VNKSKSQTGSPLQLKFLGFSLKHFKGKTGIRPHPKSLEKFKERVRELTSRKQAAPIDKIFAKLKQYTTGWLGYYSIADMREEIRRLNGWIRRRLRQIFWKQWKVIRSKHDNLKRLGVSCNEAWRWANSRLGHWRVAGSPILTLSLTNKYLASIGYDDISRRYEMLHSSR